MLLRQLMLRNHLLLTFYISAANYSNAALRARLTKTTINVINEQLKQSVVSLDTITTAFKSKLW